MPCSCPHPAHTRKRFPRRACRWSGSSSATPIPAGRNRWPQKRSASLASARSGPRSFSPANRARRTLPCTPWRPRLRPVIPSPLSSLFHFWTLRTVALWSNALEWKIMVQPSLFRTVGARWPETMSEEPIIASSRSPLAKVRRAALWVLFAFVGLIRKFVALRRKPQVWLAIRVALGLFGAALVITPLGRRSGWITSVFGLLLFLVAALLGPTRADTRVDERARELGALVVVKGGRYKQLSGRALEVSLFIGSERIWALDHAFHPLLVIPVQEIICVRAGQSLWGWSLWVEWGGPIAEFSYEGFFAEHLARVAESAVRGVLRHALPAIQPSQSSGA